MSSEYVEVYPITMDEDAAKFWRWVMENYTVDIDDEGRSWMKYEDFMECNDSDVLSNAGF